MKKQTDFNNESINFFLIFVVLSMVLIVLFLVQSRKVIKMWKICQIKFMNNHGEKMLGMMLQESPKINEYKKKIQNKIGRFSWTIADREMFIRKKIQEKICERFQPASNGNFQSLGDFAVFQRNILSRQKCKCEQNHEWWGFPWLLYNQTVISCMPCTNSMRTRSMNKK